MKKIIFLMLFFVILCSCQSNETIDLKYHVVYSVTREKGENKVSIYDSSLNLVKEKIYDTGGDYSYYYFDEIDGILFLYGPGGIIKVDPDDGFIDKVSNKDTSAIIKFENQYGFVENVGFNNDFTKYKSMIYSSLNDILLREMDYLVNSAILYDNTLITTNIPTIIGEDYFVELFDLNTHNASRYIVENFGCFKIKDGKLFYITEDYVINVSDKAFIKTKYRFSSYDEFAIIDDDIYTLSYDYEKMRCVVSSSNEIIYDHSCSGATITTNRNLITHYTGNEITVYDIKSGSSISKTLKNFNDVIITAFSI